MLNFTQSVQPLAEGDVRVLENFLKHSKKELLKKSRKKPAIPRINKSEEYQKKLWEESVKEKESSDDFPEKWRIYQRRYLKDFLAKFRINQWRNFWTNLKQNSWRNIWTKSWLISEENLGGVPERIPVETEKRISVGTLDIASGRIAARTSCGITNGTIGEIQDGTSG